MIYAGIDAGSRAIKIVLFNSRQDAPLASAICDQGVEQERLARGLFDDLLEKQGLRPGQIARIVATGYGRNLVRFASETITEITCHAAGVRRLVPQARTIIEIGGQDSKLIRLTPEGVLRDFAMNDRCAAGTGRFLELVATRLGATLQELGAMADRSRRPAAISSMCVVFAETEIIGLLAGGVPPEDIVAGVQASIAGRVGAMAGRKLDPPVVLTGGVAMVSGMARALETSLGKPVGVAPDPQMTGALGAAILASRP